MTGLFDLVSLGIVKIGTKEEGRIDVLVASAVLTIAYHSYYFPGSLTNPDVNSVKNPDNN